MKKILGSFLQYPALLCNSLGTILSLMLVWENADLQLVLKRCNTETSSKYALFSFRKIKMQGERCQQHARKNNKYILTIQKCLGQSLTHGHGNCHERRGEL